MLDGCRAISQGKRFAECEFSFHSMSEMTLGGVNIQGIRDISDISIIDAGRLLLQLSKGELPLNFTFNIQVENPNDKMAALNQLDWILLLDDNELTQGTTDRRIEVPAKGNAIMPIYITIEANKIFKKETGRSLINLILNLFGQGKANTRFTAKVKPAFLIAGKMVKYPGYIKVNQDIGRKK
jgi:hypothetical protein